MAASIKSFRAHHNLFVIEKGDNTEPSTQRFESTNGHVVGAIANIEAEMARAATPGGLAHLALMYVLVNQNQRAFDAVQRGLAVWPQHLRLLTLGSRIAGSAGDTTTQIKLLERAVAVDPADQLLARLLRQVRETRAPIAEPIVD